MLLWGPPREDMASSQGCSLHQDQACWHQGQPAHRHSLLPSRSPKPASEISPGHAGDEGQGSKEQGGKGFLYSWWQGLTDMAGLPQEWRRTLAGVVTVQVQAGASIFARLGVALVLV